ncbi:stage III sporulation protein AF [Turicibacter sp. TJ11]|uniref:stage III sporulation protein AF n=1 Tax=Turicibacter sp. TJ11 TaxID=2806443 RepID=UPI001F222095|nr:stage III sporulation protein AF [Turicibacter sp. TJ11]
MLYEYARQMIAMFFLIAVVNLLVIPASYKKIITFYLHFFIIVIILKPLISIMNNEVSSFIDSVSFVNEDEFDQSIEYYQGLVENDLSKMTMTEIESLIRKAEDDCQVQLTDFELGEVLTVKMVETDAKQKTCLLHQLGLEQSDVIFERGG